MQTKDWLFLLASVSSPVIAAWLALSWQRRKEKLDAKIRLFTTLMAFRKSYPISYEWAQALNLIDVIFADTPKVVKLWRDYYAALCRNNSNEEDRNHKYLELLFGIAKSLKFKHLQQTDIDKYYTPKAHGNQADLNSLCQVEWLRVLQNTNRILVEPKLIEKKLENKSENDPIRSATFNGAVGKSEK